MKDNKNLLSLVVILGLFISSSIVFGASNYSKIETLDITMLTDSKVSLELTLDAPPEQTVFINIINKTGKLEYFSVKEGVGNKLNIIFSKPDKEKELLYLKLSGGVVGSQAFRFGDEVAKSTSSSLALGEQLALEEYLQKLYPSYKGKTSFNVTYSLEVIGDKLTMWMSTDLKELRNISEINNIKEFMREVQYKAQREVNYPLSLILYKQNGSSLLKLEESEYFKDLPKLVITELLNQNLGYMYFDNTKRNVLYDVDKNIINIYVQGNNLEDGFATNSKKISDLLSFAGYGEYTVGMNFYDNLGVLRKRLYYYGDKSNFISNYIIDNYNEEGISIDYLAKDYKGIKYFDLYEEHVTNKLEVSESNIELKFNPTFLQKMIEDKQDVEIEVSEKVSIYLNILSDISKDELFKPELRLNLTYNKEEDSYTLTKQAIRFDDTKYLFIEYGLIDGLVDTKISSVHNDITYYEISTILKEQVIKTQENYKKQFKDINNHWASDTITELVVKGIINGINDNEFAPEANISRAEFIALLLRNFRPQLKELESRSSIWYLPYTEEGKALNLYPISDFNYLKSITREEMAYILVGALESYDLDFKEPSALFYTDTDEVSLWARDRVSIARESKLLVGFLNAFNPKNTATRAEAAQVIKNLRDYRLTTN